MVIKTVKINGFRNLINRDASFCDKRNLIHGSNGAGKTSILEAIFVPAYGKSFLGRRKSELVNHDSTEFTIHVKTGNSINENQVAAFYKNRLSLFLNDKKASIFDVNDYLYPVFFSSSDYNLYLESKPHTRKMVDRFIFGVDSLYIRCLLRYNRALKQKNCLLKTNRDIPELSSWNKTISDLCESLIGIKKMFIDRLNIEIKNKFGKNLVISYKPSLDPVGDTPGESYFHRFESIKQSELKHRRSLLGPHLDSFDIHLNDRPLRTFSSGEKKIHLVLIYIAFIELFKKAKNEYPVFLLDDFDSAIDSKNIDFLARNYPEMQIIATSVNRNDNFDQLIELKKEN